MPLAPVLPGHTGKEQTGNVGDKLIDGAAKTANSIAGLASMANGGIQAIAQIYTQAMHLIGLIFHLSMKTSLILFALLRRFAAPPLEGAWVTDQCTRLRPANNPQQRIASPPNALCSFDRRCTFESTTSPAWSSDHLRLEMHLKMKKMMTSLLFSFLPSPSGVPPLPPQYSLRVPVNGWTDDAMRYAAFRDLRRLSTCPQRTSPPKYIADRAATVGLEVG